MSYFTCNTCKKTGHTDEEYSTDIEETDSDLVESWIIKVDKAKKFIKGLKFCQDCYVEAVIKYS